MRPADGKLIDVFPINASVFGLKPDWFDTIAPRMVTPAYLLLTLLLVVSMGVLALRRFETADLEKKTWNIPVILAVMLIWPSVVWGLKTLIDTFNTFLVQDLFRIQWVEFGFATRFDDYQSLAVWSVESIIRLLPVIAYWIIYAFYLIFFFFYSVLGPLILAKGVLFDEIEAFLEIVKELAILLLWQTVLVVITSFLLPQIVSGEPFPKVQDASIILKCLILGIMMFFIPTFARKFGANLGQAFVPLGLRWGGAALGISAAGRVGASVLSAAGAPVRGHGTLAMLKENFNKAEEFKNRYNTERTIQNMETERKVLEGQIVEGHQEERHRQEEHNNQKKEVQQASEKSNEASQKTDSLVTLSKQAKEALAPKGPG